MRQISDYQIIGAEFLASRNQALLADDMGVGKTAQAIMASDLVNAKSILVICPAVARVNWRREYNEWSLFSHDFKVCETLSDQIHPFVIVSYDYATENVDELTKRDWDLVICDESHLVKEPTAQRTKAIYGINGIIRKAKFFWLLSGTPAPNNAGELWPMLYTFGITSLKHEVFIKRYCRTKIANFGGGRQTQVLGTMRCMIPEIREMLSKIMLRRMKKDVLKELPPVYFTHISVPGSSMVEVIEEDLERIKAEKKLIDGELQKAKTDLDIEKVLERLGSSISTLRRYVGLQKVEAVAEIIESELECGLYDKIGIFGYHTEVINQLKKRLAKFNPVVITGKTPTKERQESIDAFQGDINSRVFLGNIKAAGTAITLVAAHEVLFIERSTVPGENQQATDRFHRRGQEFPVHVRYASLADSYDEKVTASLVRKSNELNEIFSSNTATPTHLVGE